MVVDAMKAEEMYRATVGKVGGERQRRWDGGSRASSAITWVRGQSRARPSEAGSLSRTLLRLATHDRCELTPIATAKTYIGPYTRCTTYHAPFCVQFRHEHLPPQSRFPRLSPHRRPWFVSSFGPFILSHHALIYAPITPFRIGNLRTAALVRSMAIVSLLA